MDVIEKKKYLASNITKDLVIKYRTTIIFGEAARLFKGIFTGSILSISTAEEVKDFLDNYSKLSDEPLVFEDISLMNKQVQSYLLKFLEQDYRPIIVLASQDNLSPILLSRFNKVIKLPEDIKSDFTTLKSFVEEHEQDLRSNYVLPELKDESLLHCPEYYYNWKKLSIAKHENKNRNQIIKYL